MQICRAKIPRNPNPKFEARKRPADRNKPHKGKSEIRISKFETNRSQNKSKTRKSKTSESDLGAFGICHAWIIRICLELRASDFVLCYSPFLSLFTYASKRLSLVERWRGIAERRSGELLGPDEFLLAFEPLLEKDFDFAGPVGAKAHGADDRRHFRRGDGVA